MPDSPSETEPPVPPASPDQSTKLMPPGGHSSRHHPPLPKKIGDYSIKDIIASGGMGTVYLAFQENPRRRVALKVMKKGVTSPSALRRFEFESQTLARLRHSGIAQVYEAGTYDGGEGAVPYFAFEYIPNAKSIAEFVRAKNLGTRERLDLFRQVCEAVHHAHQKGIIHRDLKPDNILVDSSGQPKIIDFGVARSTDSDMAVTTLQTDIGQFIGTLQYMSPEQCAADPEDLDTRSDVYSLGVVLYEILCERLPYDISRVALHEAARVIREETPPKPSTINRALRGDVETITLKALEKERERRYQSASELGRDIQRYLNDDPIEARPPGVWYLLSTLMRRHRAAALAMITVMVVLVIATIVSITFWIQADQARDKADLAANFLRIEVEERKAAEEEAVAARQQAQEREQEAARQVEITKAVNDFLNQDLLAAVAPSAEFGKGKDVLMREVLDIASEKIEEQSQPGGKFADKPLIEASIRATLGWTYMQLGEYSVSEPHLERARVLRLRELGEEHQDTLESFHNMGVLLWQMDKFEEAMTYFSVVLEWRRRILGDEHPKTLMSINDMGLLFQSMGQYEEAMSYIRMALEGRLRELGKEHPDTLESFHNMGKILRLMGEYDEALPYHREALVGFRRVNGENHPDTLISTFNMGHLLQDLGKYEEALPYFRHALDGQRRFLGDDHSRTISSIHYMGTLLRNMQQLEEAETLGAEAVKLARRNFPQNWRTGAILAEHGLTLLKLDHFKDAEAELLEAHITLETALSTDHDRTQKVINYLIDLYTTWHNAEPDQGYNEKADEWRSKLSKDEPDERD